MKKRNLLPTQTAPVDRDNAATARIGEKGQEGLQASLIGSLLGGGKGAPSPFAGDDAK